MAFERSLKIIFWHWKSYFHIRNESENRILTFKIAFWHSNWVGKCYFYFQNPNLTFEQSLILLIVLFFTFDVSLKMLFWNGKSNFDIRTESENAILTNNILFWHSNWVGKCYFDFQILTFELSRKIAFWHSESYFDIRTESENRILTFGSLFSHSNWAGKCYFDFQNTNL